MWFACVLFALCFLALSAAASEPILQAFAYADTTRVSAGQPFVFDLRLSYIDGAAPLYFSLHSVDDIIADDIVNVVNSSTALQRHVFYYPGYKHVRVSVTNSAYTPAFTLSGRIAPYKLIRIYVAVPYEMFAFRGENGAKVVAVPTSECMSFSVGLRAWDLSDVTLARAKTVTRDMAAMGESPMFTLMDGLMSCSNVTFDHVEVMWRATIQGSAVSCGPLRSVRVNVSSSGVPGAHTVRTSQLSISFTPFPVEKAVTTTLPPALVTHVPALGSGIPIRVACHPCSPDTCAMFTSTTLTLSDNGFGRAYTPGSLPAGLILDAKFVGSTLIVATTSGLWSIMLATFTIQAVSGTSATNAEMQSDAQCSVPSTVADSTAVVYAALWNSTGNRVVLALHTKNMTVTIASGILARARVSLPNRLASVQLTQLKNSNTFVMSIVTRFGVALGFQFPNTNTTEVPRIIPFCFGVGLFVIYDGLWLSRDDGFLFVPVAIPGRARMTDLHVASSAANTFFAVLDRQSGMIYVGRTSISAMIPCKIIDVRLAPRLLLTFDSWGNLVVTYKNTGGKLFIMSVDPDACVRSHWLRRTTLTSTTTSSMLVPVPSPKLYHAWTLRAFDANNLTNELSDEVADINSGHIVVAAGSGISLARDADIIVPTTPCNSVDSPALGFDLTVSGTRIAVILVLRITSATDGWINSDVRKTVWAQRGVFVIQSRLNATHARAATIVAPRSLGTSPQGSWSIWDTRSAADVAAVGLQTLTVSASIPAPMQFQCRLSAGNFQFTSRDIDKVVVIGALWGSIVALVNSSAVLVVTGSSVAPAGTQQYKSGQWSMFALRPEANLAALPDEREYLAPYHRAVMPCPHEDVPDNMASNIVFVDSYQNTTIRVLASSRPSARTRLQISGLDPSLNISVQFKTTTKSDRGHYRNNGLGDQFKLTVVDGNLSPDSVITILALHESDSLTCRFESSKLAHVLFGCPVGKFIVSTLSLPMQALPINYRPPSKLGRLVPTCDNMYNVALGQPRHGDYLVVSQSSGVPKNCTGLQSATCSCTSASNQLSDQSDCIREVPMLSFTRLFLPNVTLYNPDQTSGSLVAPYRIQEINGRTDFCIEDTGSVACTSTLEPYALLWVHPSLGEGIVWSSFELYHFRVIATEQTYCTLMTEFAVFVTLSPLQKTQECSVTSTTGFGIGIILFILYIAKSRSIITKLLELK